MSEKDEGRESIVLMAQTLGQMFGASDSVLSETAENMGNFFDLLVAVNDMDQQDIELAVKETTLEKEIRSTMFFFSYWLWALVNMTLVGQNPNMYYDTLCKINRLGTLGLYMASYREGFKAGKEAAYVPSAFDDILGDLFDE